MILSLKLIDVGFERGGDAAVIAQGALSAIATHDELAFLSRVEVAAYHPDVRSRRKFVQSGLRILMQIDPIDSRSILNSSGLLNTEGSRLAAAIPNKIREFGGTLKSKKLNDLGDPWPQNRFKN